MRLSGRLAKLEAAQRKQGGFFVIRGDTEKDRRRKIDELITSGTAAPGSTFVHIRNVLYEIEHERSLNPEA